MKRIGLEIAQALEEIAEEIAREQNSPDYQQRIHEYVAITTRYWFPQALWTRAIVALEAVLLEVAKKKKR
jgi:hypothetical protein